MMADKTARKQPRGPGKPFERGTSGNPQGRPRGRRNDISILVEQLLDDKAEVLMTKVIDQAMDGDAAALRLCIERILPARRERPVRIQLPAMALPGDTVSAMSAITAAVAKGELTPGEGADVSALVANVAKAIETQDLERRIAALEQRAGR
jgi:hypothetical protein